MCCVLHLSGEWEQQHTRATKFFRRCKPNKRTKVSARTAVASRAKSLSEPVADTSRRVASSHAVVHPQHKTLRTNNTSNSVQANTRHLSKSQKAAATTNAMYGLLAGGGERWQHSEAGCTFNTTHSSQHNAKSLSAQEGKCVCFYCCNWLRACASCLQQGYNSLVLQKSVC